MSFLPFANPLWLLSLLIIPVIIYLYVKDKFKRKIYLRFSNIKLIKTAGGEVSKIKRHLPFVLQMIALFFLIIALSRPQHDVRTFIDVEGVDIILLLDLSRSMKFVDGINPNFEHTTQGNRLYYYDKYDTVPSRLQIAKKVIRDFINKRTNDQLGLVGFAEFPIALCPPTLDHNILIEYLESASLEKIGALGDTAIGDGMGVALNGLKHSKANSKLIILLTDGNSNTGEKGPVEVAKIAAKMGVKI